LKYEFEIKDNLEMEFESDEPLLDVRLSTLDVNQNKSPEKVSD